MRRVVSNYSLLLSLLLLPLSLHANSAHCIDLLHAANSPYAFVIGELLINRSNEEETVYQVGTGYMGEKILRVIPKDPNTPPYILKNYIVEQKFDIERQGYEILNRVIANNPGNHFKICHAEVVRKNLIKLSDTRGRNLGDVLEDPAIPQALRDKISKSYDEKLALLGEALKKDHIISNVDYFAQRGSKTLSANVQYTSPERVPISIRSMQVVVTFGEDPENFELTIIDPY